MKGKTLYWIFIVLGILLLAVAANGNFLSISGTNTLSISHAELQSSNSQLNGRAWLITFAQGTLGQRYYGSFTPSDVEDETPGSQRPTRSFTVSVDYADQQCRYNLRTDANAQKIYKNVNWAQYGCVLPTQSNAQANIPTGATLIDYGGISYTGGIFNGLCYAIYAPQQATVGTLSSPDIVSQYTMTLAVQGQTPVSITQNTLSGSTQGSLGSIGYAVFNGNLASGLSCDGGGFTANQYRSVYDNGQWKITNNQAYISYTAKLQNVPSRTSAYNINPTIVSQYVSDLNGYSANARAPVSVASGSVQGNSLTSGVLVRTLASPIQFPVTSLYIKADTLGVYTPAPSGRIDSASSSCFSTGNNGVISVRVTNTGNEAGTFTTFASCTSPFSSTDRNIMSLGAGESRTINIGLSGTASERSTSSCTVTLESPAGTQTRSVGVCVDPLVTCTIPSSQKFCGRVNNQDVVQQCSANGAQTLTIETCAGGMMCQDGRCIMPPTSGTGAVGLGFFGSIAAFFENLFSGTLGFLLTLKYFLIVAAFLVTLFLVKDETRRFRSLRKNSALAWIVSLIFAGGVGYLLYMFIGSFIFYAILVGFVIYAIIRRKDTMKKQEKILLIVAIAAAALLVLASSNDFLSFVPTEEVCYSAFEGPIRGNSQPYPTYNVKICGPRSLEGAQQGDVITIKCRDGSYNPPGILCNNCGAAGTTQLCTGSSAGNQGCSPVLAEANNAVGSNFDYNYTLPAPGTEINFVCSTFIYQHNSAWSYSYAPLRYIMPFPSQPGTNYSTNQTGPMTPTSPTNTTTPRANTSTGNVTVIPDTTPNSPISENIELYIAIGVAVLLVIGVLFALRRR